MSCWNTFCSFGFSRIIISAKLSQYICKCGSIKVLVFVQFVHFQFWTLVQSWTVHCLHKSPAYPDESTAKKCVEHAVAAFEPSLSLNNQLRECQNSQSLVLCTSFWWLMLCLWLPHFLGPVSVRILWCLITSKLTSQSFPAGALLRLLMAIQEPIFTEAARHELSLLALRLCHTGLKYTSRFRSYCRKLERLTDTRMDTARSYKPQLLWELD